MITEQFLQYGPVLLLVNMISDKLTLILSWIWHLLVDMLVVQYTIPEGFYRKNQKAVESMLKYIEENRWSLMTPHFMVSTSDLKEEPEKGSDTDPPDEGADSDHESSDSSDEETSHDDLLAPQELISEESSLVSETQDLPDNLSPEESQQMMKLEEEVVPEEKPVPKKKLELNEGSFVFKYQGASLWATTSIKDETVHHYRRGDTEINYIKTLMLQGFRWNRHKIEEFIQEHVKVQEQPEPTDTTLSDLIKDPFLAYDGDLVEKLEEETKKKEKEGAGPGYYIIPDRMYTDSRWVRFCDLDYIDMENVVLPTHLKNRLVEDYQHFQKKETELFYRVKGINYKRSYLLYGKPGGGKSSFIRAFATKFKMNIYEVNCNSLENMEVLRLKLSEIPKKSIVLMEDIDIIFTSRAYKKKEIKDLSADEKYNQLQNFDERRFQMGFFFNILDGIVPVIQNSILFITTNHLEKLDPALTRPGRMDIRLEFPTLIPETTKKLYLSYFPKKVQDAEEMAEIIPEGQVMPTYLVEFLREHMFRPSPEVVEKARLHFEELALEKVALQEAEEEGLQMHHPLV